MSNRKAFILVVSLFFMWGFITVIVDAFIPRLKEVFELDYLQAGLVQFAWFTAYGLLGIPGGLLIKKIGYQKNFLGMELLHSQMEIFHQKMYILTLKQSRGMMVR